jgi:hypothetical protein
MPTRALQEAGCDLPPGWGQNSRGWVRGWKGDMGSATPPLLTLVRTAEPCRMGRSLSRKRKWCHSRDPKRPQSLCQSRIGCVLRVINPLPSASPQLPLSALPCTPAAHQHLSPLHLTKRLCNGLTIQRSANSVEWSCSMLPPLVQFVEMAGVFFFWFNTRIKIDVGHRILTPA